MPEEIPVEATPPGEEPRIKDVPRNLKRYYLGLLLKGERWNEAGAQEAEDLMPLQLAFLRRQMESRRYLVAGPVLEDERIVGTMIIDAASLQQAIAIAGEDPGVRSGRLIAEVHPVFLPSLDGIRVEY